MGVAGGSEVRSKKSLNVLQTGLTLFHSEWNSVSVDHRN